MQSGQFCLSNSIGWSMKDELTKFSFFSRYYGEASRISKEMKRLINVFTAMDNP